MEDANDETSSFKGFSERLTLGITRVLGQKLNPSTQTPHRVSVNKLNVLDVDGVPNSILPSPTPINSLISLKSLPNVLDVQFVERDPAEKRCLLSWEQKNNCVLPEDLKDFYLTTDGFTLTWSSKLGNEPVPVGCMLINSVAKLQLLAESNLYSLPSAPTLADLDFEDELEGTLGGPEQPHFDSRSRIFELDPCAGNGRVCLVYKDCTPDAVAQQSEIWFLDRSLYWHFLTSSFTAYYRLMITQLGLPEWQYNFTPYGPSPQAKQWASLYQPLTYHGDLHLDPGAEPFLNKLDPAKAFSGKAKPPAPKKKQTGQAQTGGPPKGRGSRAGKA